MYQLLSKAKMLVERLSIWQYVAILIGGLVVIKGFVRMVIYPYHHDVTYLVYVSRQIVSGRIPYVDILDLNTYFVYLFNMPAVVFSKLTGLFVLDAFQVWMLMVLVAVLLVVYRQLSRLENNKSFVIYLVIWLLFIFMLDVYNIGQREYVLILLVIPYIASSVMGVFEVRFPNSWRLFVGLLAGFGAMMKPYFAIALVAVEIYVLIRKKRYLKIFRFENIGIIIAVSLFLLGLFVFLPEYFELAGSAMGNYTQFGVGYNDTLEELIFNVQGVWLIVGSMLVLLLRRNTVQRVWSEVFVLVGFASWLSAILQGTLWDYHFFPMYVATVLIWVVLIFSAINKVRNMEWWGSVYEFLLVFWTVSLSITLVAGVPLFDYLDTDILKQANEIVARNIENKTVAVFSSEIFPIFPGAISANADLTLPYYHFWPLPGFYSPRDIQEKPFPYHNYEEMDSFEREFFEKIVDSMVNDPPEVVVVEIDTGKHGFGYTTFDYLEYFSQDARFAQIMKNYQLVEESVGFAFYWRNDER